MSKARPYEIPTELLAALAAMNLPFPRAVELSERLVAEKIRTVGGLELLLAGYVDIVEVRGTDGRTGEWYITGVDALFVGPTAHLRLAKYMWVFFATDWYSVTPRHLYDDRSLWCAALRDVPAAVERAFPTSVALARASCSWGRPE